ncbi:hypothetical protein FO519_004456 [Halicephalobus sp. NKZ332]|nr:hypothetical protein FO519_004456 [Halicephalobus sp. NKZ332]
MRDNIAHFLQFLSQHKEKHVYKYVGLILLTVQQACMPLLVRSTRYRKEDEVFITTVNVFIMEAIKLALCSGILIFQEKSIPRFLSSCKSAVFDDFSETMKICIPAIIYILQNNLYYVALTNLEPTTFCVTYQLKILTTALMLKFILGKNISPNQWIALVLLIVGISDVQLQYQPPAPMAGYLVQKPFVGFLAVATMCFTSAFAGVYMEKVLKQSTVNVWMQNIRLALFGLVISLISMLYRDYNTIQIDGFFRGFDGAVCLMTFMNASGGLLIAVVMKYADNIMKSYAQSTAIVGAAIGSWLLFDFVPNGLFVFGTALVVISIIIYTKYPPKEDKSFLVHTTQKE